MIRTMSRGVCTRASQIQSRKLRFLPVRPKTAPARTKYVEPRLLQTLKESYSEWEMRGQCSDDLIEKVLKLLDKKQNNIKYEVISRHDPARVVAARRCPEVEWGRSTILGNTVERGYNTNIVTLLCPVKQSDAQVLKTHVGGHYLVRDKDYITIESLTLLKQAACLVKLALPNLSVFRCDTYIEVVGVNGYTLHLCPVVAMTTKKVDNKLVPAAHTMLFSAKLDEHWLMCSGKSTWQPFSQLAHLTDSATLHSTVVLLSELRMLHSLHLTLEDCVALVNTAIKEHSQDTGYTGPVPLHHSFTLTLRLLLHTLQSSRVIRHPKTKDIALRKLVFGRSHKYDAYVRDIVKVCLMFLRMEQIEEFSGLFPPTPLTSLGEYEESSSSEEEEEEFSDSVQGISDLDDEEEIMNLDDL